MNDLLIFNLEAYVHGEMRKSSMQGLIETMREELSAIDLVQRNLFESISKIIDGDEEHSDRRKKGKSSNFDNLFSNSLIKIIEKELRNHVSDVLDELQPRERSVLELKNGIGSRIHSFASIASELGYSEVWIREIYKKAFRKLRHPSRYEPLRRFWWIRSFSATRKLPEDRLLEEIFGAYRS